MRTLKLLALGVVFVAGAAFPVHAQAPAEQTPTPAPQPQPTETTSDDGGRFFLNVSIGGQSKEQIFEDSSTFRIYNETGAIASAHSIGGGTLFDVSLGAKVWKNVGIGIAYSTLTNKNDATVSVRVPHPVIFGQSRTATATAVDLEHSENVVHLQFMWIVPLTNKFQLAFMAGPSFLRCGRPLPACRRIRTSTIHRRLITSVSGPSA